MLDTLCGIFRVTRNIGTSGLHHAKDREDGPRCTRQQQGDATARFNTTLAQGISNAVGCFVHFLIGIGGVTGYQSFCIRLLLSIITDAVVVEFKWHLASGHFTQMAQRLLLVLADDGELANLHLWLSHHVLNDSYYTLSQRIAKTGRVNGVIVLYQHTTRLNLDIDFELRHV